MKDLKITRGRWKVQHSESKTAYNVVGTVLGGNYKIARCPYLEVSDAQEFNEREKSECLANAELIAQAGTIANETGLMPKEMQKALNDMFLNMQYYMEYCQENGYVTPQVWFSDHKHY